MTKKIQLRGQQSGFTLAEVLVAMSVFVLIAVIGGNMIVDAFKMTTFNAEQEEAVKVARDAIGIITKEMRGANISDQGHYPLMTIGSDDLEFFSDIDYNNSMEKIRYFQEDTFLYRVITKAGPAKDYSLPGATTTVANYVNNQSEPVFEYYDGARVETADIDSIRLVRIILKINVTPTRAPNDYYVEADVHLRNLKDNL